jgi:hypothetical protein
LRHSIGHRRNCLLKLCASVHKLCHTLSLAICIDASNSTLCVRASNLPDGHEQNLCEALRIVKHSIRHLFYRLRSASHALSGGYDKNYGMAAKNPAAVALGRRGGKARVKNQTPEQRSESARKAAAARWAKNEKRIAAALKEITAGTRTLLKKSNAPDGKRGKGNLVK